MKSSSRDAQWNEARKNLRGWLAANKKSQSELARLAGLNRSVVNRFLEKDQPLSTATASKLFNILKLNLDPAEHQRWIEWLNLDEMQASLREPLQPANMTPPIGPYPNIEIGNYWLKEAWVVLRNSTRIPESLPLLKQAELAFGSCSTLAALAACQQIQQLINLSDLELAEREIFRVEQAYQHVMDVQTLREFLHLKGMVAYDRQDYARALLAVDDLKVMEGTYGFATLHQHIGALALLGMAEHLEDADPARQRLLALAENNIRFMCQDAEMSGNMMHIGFMHLRLAQVLREQGRHADASPYFKLAQQCFEGNPAIGHIAVEEANMALLNGETTRAHTRVESAEEMWLPIFYAGGLGRVSAVTALSLFMDGRPEEALEPAVAAASIAPFGSCFKGDPFVDLPLRISSVVRRTFSAHQYAALIAQMQGHVHMQSGHFACLAHVVPDRSGAALELLAKLQ